ncbi:MAG: BamA/TamA family outer membrane protein [Muribaculaceae bacterium]|nr:BamA/TamA family outer membrane protein [Muribaculaceae bacterium]
MKRILLYALMLVAYVATTAFRTDSIASLTEPQPEVMYQTPSLELTQPEMTQMAVLETELDTAAVDTVPKKKPGFFRRLFAGLTEGHIDRTHEKAIDLSFVAFPSYSNEPGFGIGAAMTGFYRINRQDSILPPSDIFVSINASLRGFFQIYAKGNNIFPNGKSRLSYIVSLYRMPLYFWGINAEECRRNERSQFDRLMADIQVNYLHKIHNGFFVGARFRSNFTAGTKILKPEYMLGQNSRYYTTGIGLIIEYDTRDNLLNPSSGVHLSYSPMFFPSVFGTATKSFWNNTFFVDWYQKIWPHAILAFDFYGGLNTADTPWTMREQVNVDGIRQRGYYMGSVIDNNQFAAQVEIRQHIYKRLGLTGWFGYAVFFDRFSDFKKGGASPWWLRNYGIGLRFEIKHNANVRLDCGFNYKNEIGIMFAFGEAF